MEANEIKKIIDGCKTFSEGVMAVVEGAKKIIPLENAEKVGEENSKVKKEETQWQSDKVREGRKTEF